MRITPKQESELKRPFNNLPDGEYPFTVMESDEVASKSAKNAGKMMFKLKLCVHGPEFDKHVYDYFADWFSEWKLRHFAATVGMLDKYEAGVIDAINNALQNRTGYVRIVTENDSQYGDKNIVDDYVMKDDSAKLPTGGNDGDDVPF